MKTVHLCARINLYIFEIQILDQLPHIAGLCHTLGDLSWMKTGITSLEV